MGDLNRTLPVGGLQNITAAGRTVFVKDANAPVRVTFDGSDRYVMGQGDRIERNDPFAEFRIENPGNDPLDLTLTVTDGTYAQRSVSGEVTIDDTVPVATDLMADDAGNPGNLVQLQATQRALVTAIQNVDPAAAATLASAYADAVENKSLTIGDIAQTEAIKIAQAINNRSPIPGGSKQSGARFLGMVGVDSASDYAFVGNTGNEDVWLTSLSIFSDTTTKFEIKRYSGAGSGFISLIAVDKFDLTSNASTLGVAKQTNKPGTEHGELIEGRSKIIAELPQTVISCDAPLKIGPDEGLRISLDNSGFFLVTAHFVIEQ